MSEILTLDDLEMNMDEKAEKQKQITDELTNLFTDAGFVIEHNPNTIAFESSIKDAKALFSVDNSTFNYKSYISVEGENETNYSTRGNIDGVVDAAIKFIEQWAEFADGVEYSEDEVSAEGTGDEVDEDE